MPYWDWFKANTKQQGAHERKGHARCKLEHKGNADAAWNEKPHLTQLETRKGAKVTNTFGPSPRRGRGGRVIYLFGCLASERSEQFDVEIKHFLSRFA